MLPDDADLSRNVDSHSQKVENHFNIHSLSQALIPSWYTPDYISKDKQQARDVPCQICVEEEVEEASKYP